MSPNRTLYTRQIRTMLENRDLNGLVALLRGLTHPELRAQAAQALGDMGDVDATESLVRSNLEDPDGQVQTAAHRALKQLLGNQAQLVINSYRGGPPESDAWLVEPDDESEDEDEELLDAGEENDEESGELDELTGEPLEGPAVSSKRALSIGDISLRLDDHDLNGLVAILRSPAQPELRAQAALALGRLGDADATESLVRSTREDPNAAVQAAARQALEQLHGNRAQLAVDSYPLNYSESDPWLVEPDEDQYDAGQVVNDDLDLDGLMRIASHESNRTLRLKAIHMLAFSSDLRATDILAYLALRDENKTIRAAARVALEERHGKQAEQILQSYQESLKPSENEPDDFDEDDRAEAEDEDEEEEDDEDLDEDLAEEEEDEEEDEEPESRARDNGYDRIQRSPSDFPRVSAHPPHGGGVVEESGFPWQTVLLIGLVIVIIIVVVLLLNGSL